MSPPSGKEEIDSLVGAARAYVTRALGVELDGSETSLAFVDHYIEHTARAAALKDDVLLLVASALGAYFGEVAIAKFGGRWMLDGEPPAWRIELDPIELRFHPVAMAACALRGDEVDGYDDAFNTRPEWMVPLGEALAAAPPVDAAYFYSMTGRLETLEQVVQILLEFERRRVEKEQAPGTDEPSEPDDLN